MWVMVTGYNPLRAYVHELGLVLFSNQGYDAAAGALNDAGDVAVGHVTNYAQNMHGGARQTRMCARVQVMWAGEGERGVHDRCGQGSEKGEAPMSSAPTA